MYYDKNGYVPYTVYFNNGFAPNFEIHWLYESWTANVYLFTQRAYVELHIHPSNKEARGLIFNHTDHVQK